MRHVNVSIHYFAFFSFYDEDGISGLDDSDCPNLPIHLKTEEMNFYLESLGNRAFSSAEYGQRLSSNFGDDTFLVFNMCMCEYAIIV